MFGEELIDSFGRFEQLIESYPGRGLKGAGGTQMDQLSLFGGDINRVKELESGIASSFVSERKQNGKGRGPSP